jgi:hypothetical protein
MSTRTTHHSQNGASNNSNPENFPLNAPPAENVGQHEAQNDIPPSPAWEDERKALEQTVADLRAGEQQFLERYVGLEEQNSALTTLYVACQSLHSSLDRAQILLTAREIIANLIGCEEYVLFSVAPDGWLVREDSFGLDAAPYEKLPPGEGIIGRTVSTGEICKIEESGRSEATELEANLTACIPLKLKGAVTGAIALFRLLPQKFELQNLDHELFLLLETHLAHALHCSELQLGAGSRNGVGA